MHLERCAQRAQVIAAVENFPLALEEPVRKLADSSANALHSAGDRVVGLRLDQQMHVIALDRVVHDTEAVADAGFAQGGTEPSHEPRLTERRYIASQADRHMHRHTRDDALALPVHDPWSYPTRPTGAVARSATTRAIAHRVERELLGFFPFG